jgi:hypothetical protein
VAHRPEASETVRFVDDGSLPGDVAADGLYLARIEGTPIRFLDAELRDRATNSTVYRRILAIPERDDPVISFQARIVGDDVLVERAAFVPYLGGMVQVTDPVAVALAGAWLAAGAVYLGLLAWRAERR